MNEHGEPTRHDADYASWVRPDISGSLHARVPFDQKLAWTQDIHDGYVDEETDLSEPDRGGPTPVTPGPEWAVRPEFPMLMRGLGGEGFVAE